MTPMYFKGKLERRLANILLSMGLLVLFFLSSYVIWYRSIHRLFTDRLEISLKSVPNGETFRVSDLAVNSKGDIVVCDRDNSRVICFSAVGSFAMEIGHDGSPEGYAFLPSALVFDCRDSLYVACHEEILIFDPRFNFARKFKVDFARKTNIGFNEIIQDPSRFGFFTKSMAVDTNGDIYLVGYRLSGIVHKFTSHGRLVRSFGDAFNHPNYRIRKYYSGGRMQLEKDRMYLTHQVPYNVTVYDLDGTPIGRFLRPEIDFIPRFEVEGTRHTYRTSSRGIAICKVDSLVINQYSVLNEGMYIDVYDLSEGFAYRNIPLNAYLIGADRKGNIYYLESNTPGASIFRGRIVAEYRNYDKVKM